MTKTVAPKTNVKIRNVEMNKLRIAAMKVDYVLESLILPQHARCTNVKKQQRDACSILTLCVKKQSAY